MSYEERIRQDRSNMSKSFAKLADFLLDSYIESAFMTASELAHELDLDAATVVRFAQTLGYTGFPELQREIRQRVLRDLPMENRRRDIRIEGGHLPPALTAVVGNKVHEAEVPRGEGLKRDDTCPGFFP